MFNGTLRNDGIYVSCVNVTFVNIENIDALFYKLDDAEYTPYTESFMICESGEHELWWYWIYHDNSSEECIITLQIDRNLPTVHLSSERISISADELNIPVQKMIGIYPMIEDVVTGITRILQKYHLPYLPMIHCFLIYDSHRVDLTEDNNNGKNHSIGEFLFTEKCYIQFL